MQYNKPLTYEYRRHRLKYHLFEALPKIQKELINLILLYVEKSVSDELFYYLLEHPKFKYVVAPNEKFPPMKIKRLISWWLKDTEFHKENVKKLGIYIGYKNREWKVKNPKADSYCYDYDNCGDRECACCSYNCECNVCIPFIKEDRKLITVSKYIMALSRKDLDRICRY